MQALLHCRDTSHAFVERLWSSLRDNSIEHRHATAICLLFTCVYKFHHRSSCHQAACQHPRTHPATPQGLVVTDASCLACVTRCHSCPITSTCGLLRPVDQVMNLPMTWPLIIKHCILGPIWHFLKYLGSLQMKTSFFIIMDNPKQKNIPWLKDSSSHLNLVPRVHDLPSHRGCELMRRTDAHDVHYAGFKNILKYASKPYKEDMNTQSSGTMTLTDEEIKRYSDVLSENSDGDFACPRCDVFKSPLKTNTIRHLKRKKGMPKSSISCTSQCAYQQWSQRPQWLQHTKQQRRSQHTHHKRHKHHHAAATLQCLSLPYCWMAEAVWEHLSQDDREALGVQSVGSGCSLAGLS